MHRLHPRLQAETDEPDEQIGIADQCNPLPVNIRMAVEQGIHHPAAFLKQRCRDRKAGQPADRFQQTVSSRYTKRC
ncbi:hypothetical protein D3C73_1333460 [compost metagenome]